jgi:hypothetical protein
VLAHVGRAPLSGGRARWRAGGGAGYAAPGQWWSTG